MASNDRRRRAQHEQRRRTGAEERRRASRRRTRIVAAVVAGLVVLSTFAGVFATVRSDGETSASSTTSGVPSTTTPVTASYPATGAEPAPAAPGVALTGPTPCPPEDGSAPRTTQFAEPPPTCIDLGRFHTAVITTSAGPLTFQLNPSRAPETTNAFVVLARYHFYDGLPITRIRPRAWFEAGTTFAGDGSWGFPIPDEVPPAGQIFTPGTIAMAGEPGQPGTNRGGLLVATLDQAPSISDEVTSFGILLDGAPTLAAIDRAASQDGLPTSTITIESVTVTPGPPLG
jgi:cyclophilin family peptidyl-prolyl cis-trans isomerase